MANYEELKKNNDLKVKDWFKPSCRYEVLGRQKLVENSRVYKESEKAALITFDVCRIDGSELTEELWVPKSCFESFDSYQLREEEKTKRYERACDDYARLVAFCKANRIKGARTGLRKETLLNKVKNAGLSFQA